MTATDVTVYGAHWCPDCRRSKQFLGEHQIPYNWVDIEVDPEAEKLDNMPGIPDSVAGIDFSQRLRQRSERFGVELLQAREVTGLFHRDNWHGVRTNDGSEYSADALLLATGSRYRRLNVPGVFAAGDVRDTSTKQVVSAAGERSTAALLIREYSKSA